MLNRICCYALLLNLMLAIAARSSAADVLTGPVLAMNPNGVTPLAGVVTLTTDVPSRVSLAISDGTESWGVEFPELRLDHSVPVLGLKPSSAYTIEVTVTDHAGNRRKLSPALHTATAPLPADFPKISTYWSQPSRMEPGYILLDKTRRPFEGKTEYAMILDLEGQVRWYSTRGGYDGMRQLPNGRLLLLNSEEMDLLGNVFVPRKLDVPGFFLHHDMFPMQNGNFLSLTLEKVVIPNYRTSEIDPNAPRQTLEVTSDGVVEFRPDGSLKSIWHLHEMLDPMRIGYDSTKPGFPLFDSPDWSHANAVFHDTRDDSILVSIRHQDAVIKFSRSTGRLIWILGPHANWGPEFQPYLLQPVGTPFEWQFHQHAMKVTPSGTLLLFDNGNYRASPFDGQIPQTTLQSYSRAVEYAIDEATMQVRQVWEYGADIDWKLFSTSQGDADLMPRTGNVVLTLSDTQHIAGAPTASWGLGFAHTAILEVDHNTPAEKVLDLRIYDTSPTSRTWVYRSERIPSLYAQNVQIVPDSDRDGVLDNTDNCTLTANANQRDTDGDGFGSACDPDLNNDGVVEWVDYFYYTVLWQSADANADLDGDGVVTWPDLQVLVDKFFGAPGPSGVAAAAPAALTAPFHP
jgi:arylsulfate sulfotransferase